MSEEVVNIHEVAAPASVDALQKKMKLKGTVTRLELYGAFVDVGLGTPAILHISQLGQRVNRVSDVLSVGQEVELWVDKVDAASGQVTVTMQEPLAVEWGDLAEGNVYTGTITRLENFGAFIDIGAEKEGLAHVSELSHDYVKHPSEVIRVGDEVQVQVLGFSRKKRRINLSLKSLQEKPEPQLEQLTIEELDVPEEEPDDMPTAMEMALRSALNSNDNTGRDKRRGKKRKNKKMSRGRAMQNEILMRTLEMEDMDGDY